MPSAGHPIGGPGLIFSSDRMPGYRRRRYGRGFRYLLPDGEPLKSTAEIRRIRSLAIPPAYSDVWICRISNGHLQATGLDARRRKQYRYHPLWHAYSGERKFSALPEFARALPGIRMKVREALSRDDLSQDRVVAGVIALLDETGFRIGNQRYAEENGTYGLSSLLSRHLREQAGELLFRFVGKSGTPHETHVASPALARLMQDLHDLPGQHLFRFEGEDGSWQDIESADINRWLKEIGGGDFTAKQFRTWKATVLCARILGKLPPPESRGAREKEIRRAVKETAAVLLHTAATCRKFYIHPVIPGAFRTGLLHRVMNASAPVRKTIPALKADERRVYSLLAPSGKTKASNR